MRWFRRRDPLDRFWQVSFTDQDIVTCPEAEAAYRTQLLWIACPPSDRSGAVVGRAAATFHRTRATAERARRRVQADNRYQGTDRYAMACVFDAVTGANLTVPSLT